MVSFKKIISVTLAAALLASCTNDSGEINKQALIGVTGAVAGGALGSNVGKGSGRTAAIIGGALLGGMVGSEVGRSLDKADIAYHSRTQGRALEYNRAGTTSSWSNPDSGASGTFTPVKTMQSGDRYCREYTQTITVGGKTERGHGTACRNPDGTWAMQ
ncbi:MAG: RT0821/Lpp0805 family surface protein [Alphaproteobacteria bacterium]|jgi:surface antigen|nr:glycine zipper 2TM domain-containing protein [Candidatus Jidaibacter sp.]